MSARAAYESGKSPETLAGRDAWYRSEEERLAAGIAKGADNWKPTGGFVAPGVIDNGDGTYRPNDIYINPEDYWMSVCRNAPSMFIYDNSYVKCRELTLSYNVPKSTRIPTTTIPPVWDLNTVRCLHAEAMVLM